MGRRHVQVLQNLGHDVQGIFDPSPDAVATSLKENALAPAAAFRRVEDMLRQVRPDLVVVASTAPSHCEYVCMAAAAGVRYVLCEKPMAVSLAECDRMIEACAQSGSMLGVNHQMRFMEQYTFVKQLAVSAAFDGLRSIVLAAGNFGLAMNGSHYFEMLRFMADDEIASVSSWLDSTIVPNPRGPQYQDRSGQLRAVTDSGVRLYMDVGGDQGHGIQLIYNCRLGQIFVDEISGYTRFVHRESAYADLPTTRYGMPAVETIRSIAPTDVIGPTESMWRAMISGESFPDGAAGRHVVAALVAAHLSGEAGGKAATLDEALPRDRVFPWA
ncbi:MAG: hypothetical protein JWO70_4516 [Betaproteobacteria bacterium]|nr:hypothetical protein [Betaproteobacteria bacterium]